MFKKSISIIFTLALFSTSALAIDLKPTYSDVENSYQYNVAINFLTEKGVINGYPDGSFKPENAINRAEILKIILKGSNIEASIEFKQDFPDVQITDWFANFVSKAKELGIVSGNLNDGTFTPNRQVNLAEFLKMLILANNLDASQFADIQIFDYIDQNEWYTQYINFATKAGLLDIETKIDPSKALTRGETVNMMYLLSLITNGDNTQFLLTRAELELAQTEIFLSVKNTKQAKNSSSLAIDLTQKALKNIPDNNIVLGAAKLAKAYDYLVTSFTYGTMGEKALATEFANNAINKATEAWEVNPETQTIAKHIKDLATEILNQIGVETTI